jgi:hypothetical protein
MKAEQLRDTLQSRGDEECIALYPSCHPNIRDAYPLFSRDGGNE